MFFYSSSDFVNVFSIHVRDASGFYFCHNANDHHHNHLRTSERDGTHLQVAIEWKQKNSKIHTLIHSLTQSLMHTLIIQKHISSHLTSPFVSLSLSKRMPIIKMRCADYDQVVLMKIHAHTFICLKLDNKIDENTKGEKRMRFQK